MFKYKELKEIFEKLCNKYNLEYVFGNGFISGDGFSCIIIKVMNCTLSERPRLLITDWIFGSDTKTHDVTTKSFDEIEKCLRESIKKFKEYCVKRRLDDMEKDFEN